MSKTSETPESSSPGAAGAPTAPETKQEARQQLQVNDSKAIACYANFCRVTGTPEEAILDFALNSQPMGVPTDPIAINQRIIVNYFTAKRLLAALHMTVQRHEAAFGVLETDVQKRVQQPKRQS